MAGRHLLARWRERARALQREPYALMLAARHPDTPWYARLWAAAVVAYLLCPLDLVPDFLPLVGQLDDLILVPLGLWLAYRLIPPGVLAECRGRAREVLASPAPPAARAATLAVVATWLLALGLLAILIGRHVLP
jgi:uncharacterized membrane protein YkvA (DUF1232 family)